MMTLVSSVSKASSLWTTLEGNLWLSYVYNTGHKIIFSSDFIEIVPFINSLNFYEE